MNVTGEKVRAFHQGYFKATLAKTLGYIYVEMAVAS